MDILHVPGLGSKRRPFVTCEMIQKAETVPVMDGKAVFKLAVTRMPEVTREVLTRCGYTLDDLDLLVMHQANLRINEAAQKAMKLPNEKVHNNIQKYGNTTSATLPIAFHEARQEGKAPGGGVALGVGADAGVGGLAPGCPPPAATIGTRGTRYNARVPDFQVLGEIMD
jgi:3-oxoacyl-[acyl-carrier-protein] synthase-3